MFYTINMTFILVISFVQIPYYFNSLYFLLKDKMKYYSSKITRFVFNFYWLAELLANSKPTLHNIALKSHLTREIPQHLECIGKAIKLGQVYCPSKKGAVYDGCFYDPVLDKVTEIIQHKLKSEGSNLTIDTLAKWIEKYVHLSTLDIGFLSPEDFKFHSALIYKMDDIQRLMGSNLNITCRDYSPYLSAATCRPDVMKLIETQSGHNDIVFQVNKDMAAFFGEVSNFPM